MNVLMHLETACVYLCAGLCGHEHTKQTNRRGRRSNQQWTTKLAELDVLIHRETVYLFYAYILAFHVTNTENLHKTMKLSGNGG